MRSPPHTAFRFSKFSIVRIRFFFTKKQKQKIKIFKFLVSGLSLNQNILVLVQFSCTKLTFFIATSIVVSCEFTLNFAEIIFI